MSATRTLVARAIDAELIGELITDISDAIERELGMKAYIAAQGGPYEASLLINYEKKLASAAAAAISAIVLHPKLRPPQDS